MKRKRDIETPVLPVGTFTPAEDYHQKFYLRQQHDLEKELTAIYPDAADFRNSTAAMRLNAYLAGHGTPKTLEKEIDSFGLSGNGQKTLRAVVKSFADAAGEGR